jgi:hypothetical protein
MKWSVFLISIVGVCLGLLMPVCVGAQDATEPAVFLPETSYEFAPVLDGTKVVHDFVIQNKGTAELKVEQVKTG